MRPTPKPMATRLLKSEIIARVKELLLRGNPENAMVATALCSSSANVVGGQLCGRTLEPNRSSSYTQSQTATMAR